MIVLANKPHFLYLLYTDSSIILKGIYVEK